MSSTRLCRRASRPCRQLGYHRGIRKLDACTALIEVRDHRAKSRSLAALEDHRFSKVERGAIDLAGLLLGPGHHGRQTLEDQSEFLRYSLSIGDENRRFDDIAVGQASQRAVAWA